MATPAKQTEDDLAALKSIVSTTSRLVAQLQTSAASSKEKDQNSKINALDLAHDAASLIRAHSTKLSLLIINKPFTPSAINKVLRDLVAGPLPWLSSALELCNEVLYTKAMNSEMEWRVKKLFIDLGVLIDAIPLDEEILRNNAKNGTGKAEGKGSLASTGVIWESCDNVMELRRLGVAGLVIKKAQEYQALVKDALDELQDWGEEESDEDISGDDGSIDEEKDVAQSAVDDIFGSPRHIPSDDPEKIRPRLVSSQKRLRLIILMYQAIVKRRLKTLPCLLPPEISLERIDKRNDDPDLVTSLDKILLIMKKIPEITDELVNAFYELDGQEIDKRMDECFSTGFDAAELMSKNWQGELDEFSAWADKFQLAMKKGW